MVSQMDEVDVFLDSFHRWGKDSFNEYEDALEYQDPEKGL